MPSISPIRIIDDRALAYMPLFSNPAFQFHRTSCDNIFLSKNKCSLFECIFFVNIGFKIKKPLQFMLFLYLTASCCTLTNPPSLIFH